MCCVSSLTDEYWAAHPELHDIPIYYASALAQKCMAGRYAYIHMYILLLLCCY